jgi:hypothetical protein
MCKLMGSFNSQPMVFVTGASRSGTTMLTQILGRHSEVCGLRETHYFGGFCDPLRDPADHPIDVDRAVTTLFVRLNEGIHSRSQHSSDPAISVVLDALDPGAGAAETFATVAATFARRAGKAVPCEQTPRNVYYARALLEWYPRCRFVHVLRDPRGVMASQKFRWRRRSLLADPTRLSRVEQLRTWVNYHPYAVARLWNLATRCALELEHHPRVHLLRLEDLLREPEQRMRAVCEFLDLDFEPGMLDIERVNSSHVAKSSAGRGLDASSIDAWRGRLTGIEQAIVHRRCGALMRRVGYSGEPLPMSRAAWTVARAGYMAHALGAVLINPRRLSIQLRALLASGVDAAAGRADGIDVPSAPGMSRRSGGTP